MYVLHGRLVSTSNINIQCVLCCSVLIRVLVCLGRRSTANKTVLTCLVLWGKSAKFTVHRVHEDLLGRPTFGEKVGSYTFWVNAGKIRPFLETSLYVRKEATSWVSIHLLSPISWGWHIYLSHTVMQCWDCDIPTQALSPHQVAAWLQGCWHKHKIVWNSPRVWGLSHGVLLPCYP